MSTPRESLLHAIQLYAEEWKNGKSVVRSPAKVALWIELDKFELSCFKKKEEGCSNPREVKRYVLGFCFGPLLRTVVLIQKTRNDGNPGRVPKPSRDGTPPAEPADSPRVPEWQAGRLNGVGGHIEEGESPAAAMAREFREEAACVEVLDWKPFGRLQAGDQEVYLFHARFPYVPHPYNISEEGEVSAHHVSVVVEGDTSKGARAIPSLRYLIPMALNHLKGEESAFLELKERVS